MTSPKSPLFISLFIVAITANSFAQNAKPKFNIPRLVDSISHSLNGAYIFPDKAKIISEYLVKRLKNKAYSQNTNPVALAESITTDIYKAHRDPHMRVLYYPRLVEELKKGDKQTADEKAGADRFWKENNHAFRKAEVLAGNIGYIKFDGFVDNIEAAKTTVSSAMQFIANTSAVIIDLRTNGGGNPKMVNYIESFFFKEKTRMNDIIDGPSGDTTFFMTDPARAEGIILSQPVYILTSKQTFSAAEDFTYGMKNAKRAVIVGDTTGGGAHPTTPVSVGQGFVVLIPFARSFNHLTGTDWEGIGVIPDIATPALNALQKTQELIYTGMYKTATDETAKKRFTYLLNSSKELTVKIDVASLHQFTGVYAGGLNFYIKENRLYCKNDEREGLVTELKPLSDKLFVLDENVQVEFLEDKSGKVSKLILHFFNGFDVEKMKER